VLVLEPLHPGNASEMDLISVMRHLTLTAETHNFPTGVAPFPGAETGAGGWFCSQFSIESKHF
jgi:phosphoribosylformylglycinamidine synthase